MKKTYLLLVITAFIFACKKDPKPEPITSDFSQGVFCMNEGLFQQNNATLSFYSIDSNKITSNVFSNINGRGLGDTANDIISYFYQGKKYIAIAVDVSSQIEILDGITLNSVKQIPIFNETSARQPRSLQYYEGYLYSINFDGTVSVINLSTNTITYNINCGQNPEQSVIINNQLFVVNSGGLNSPTYDNTVTIINLTSNSSSTTFQTDINCSSIKKDDQNELYIISRGDYNSISPKLLRINSSNNITEQVFNIDIGRMCYYNNTLYYFDNNDQGIHKLNTVTELIDPNIFIDCSDYTNLYNIQVDENNNLIYLTDANGYVNSSIVTCYDLNGNYKYEFTSGLNTGKLLFN
jgi:YVTN family beta-propeller protein